MFVAVHFVIGLGVYFIPYFAQVYAYASILYGLYYVIKTQNKSNEAVMVAAYFVGSEIVFRMTQALPIYEFAKYGVILVMLLGMYFSGASKGAVPYWLFLIILIPGAVIATYTLEYSNSVRKAIAFNLSGPVCLGICSIYTYRRRITSEQMNKILLWVALPMIPAAVYLYLFVDNIRDVITGTSSNSETSGGFGPNQVSTMLGLAMFLYFNRLLFQSKKLTAMAINLSFAAYFGYRGLLTFSRGGMFTAIIILAVLLMVTYLKINSQGKRKARFIFLFLIVASIATWQFSNLQTDGLIIKRYNNEDAAGRVKKSQLTGRGELAEGEINAFFENPIFGVGVGKMTELRRDNEGVSAASHSEITRMLAEHGTLGIIGLLILLLTPPFLALDNKQNIYIFSFLIFWLLTINHAAMRLAAPAFIYSLSLLKVYDDKTPVVHREQIG